MRPYFCVALVPAIACVIPPSTPPELDQIDKPCFSCGTGNSPMVQGHSISWLRLDGSGNDSGVKFVQFLKSGVPRPLDINKNVLRYWGGDGAWHGYKDLEGTVIRVASGDNQYDVKIEEVHAKNCPTAGCIDHGIRYWTTLDSDEAESYLMRWTPTGNASAKPKEVCPPFVEEVSGGHLYQAVVFEGDYYNPNTRNIRETSTAPFAAAFNIACMGSLPAKMELARRTAATSDATYTSTIADDRQALARVWAAQYCGRTAFTQTGHLLKVVDRRGWLNRDAWSWPEEMDPTTIADFQYEAVWSATGAVCLDTPRLAVPDPNVPIHPSVGKMIRAECGEIPPCTGQPWFPNEWTKYGQFLTATIAEDGGR